MPHTPPALAASTVLAGAPELEVTPQMIEAAAAVLHWSAVEDLYEGWVSADDVAARMVAAALSARRDNP